MTSSVQLSWTFRVQDKSIPITECTEADTYDSGIYNPKARLLVSVFHFCNSRNL